MNYDVTNVKVLQDTNPHGRMENTGNIGSVNGAKCRAMKAGAEKHQWNAKAADHMVLIVSSVPSAGQTWRPQQWKNENRRSKH